MLVKKYTANTVNEALTRIKYELGSEAIIISQRKVRRPGFKGIFLPQIVEITAAMENKSTTAEKKAYRVAQEAVEDNIANKAILTEIQQMKKELKKISHEKDPLELLLKDNDVDELIIEEILHKLEKAISENIDPRTALREALKEYIEISNEELKGNVVLVGPTGVGKTTTIAKLAGRLALIEKKKVGLITVDTYRIGAVEQLRTYAEIMNIPFKVVITLKEMEEAISSMGDCDVVLIDTIGRSSKNKMQMSELRAFINKSNSQSINLVISSVTKNSDIKTIVEGYSNLGFSSVIITKLDETSVYGGLLTILRHCRAPIRFLTIGQKVPEDIIRPTKDEIINLVLGEESVC